MEHGKVDSKNNHYVHSHWRAGWGRQIQVRLWSVFRKSGCSLSSSSQDCTPLITSEPGKLKPDATSKSWHLLMRMKKGAEIGFFFFIDKHWRWKVGSRCVQNTAVGVSVLCRIPECTDLDVLPVLWSRAGSSPTCQPRLFARSQGSIAMASLSSPCFTSKWDPQPKRTEDFVPDSPVTGTAEISRFPTS